MSDAVASGSTSPKESRTQQVVIIQLSMLALSSIAVIARIWIRFDLVSSRLTRDDWAILVSFAFALAFVVDVICQTRHGLGKHVYDLPEDTDFAESLRLFYYGEALYYIAVGMTKVAILFLYLRIAVEKRLRIVIWTTMAFVVLTFVTCVIAGVFQCKPIPYAWDKTIPDGRCFNVTALFYANAGLNIFQDLFIYILPMKTLWEVQIPHRQKIALIVVFAVGGFVCVTGMIRLDSLRTASISKDPTWDNFGSAIWSGIECNVGVVCASLPHFKPLLTRYFPGIMGIQRMSTMTPLSDGVGRSKGTPSSRSPDVDNFGFPVSGSSAHGRGYKDDERAYSVAIVSKSGYNSSEEHLRSENVDDVERRTTTGGGIYKSTRITLDAA